MQRTVSTIIIAAPISRTEEFGDGAAPLLDYMERSFPGIEFLLDLASPMRQQEAFGLIPIAGEAGDGARMYKPLDDAKLTEMYEVINEYGAKPALN